MEQSKVIKRFNVRSYYMQEQAWELREFRGEQYVGISGTIYRPEEVKKLIKGLQGLMKKLEAKNVTRK